MTRSFSIKNTLLYILVVSMISACSLLSVEPDDDTKDNTEEIQTYLRNNNLNYTQTTSGMYYDVTKTNPSGKSVTIGEEVRAYFQVTLLNGTVIDSILTGDPLSYGYFEGRIFEGFTEAVSILREGEKGVFIIPSALAYRNQSVPGVPAGSAVRLELEILSFRNEEQQIKAYITNNSFEKVAITPTGLRFIPIDTTAIAAPLTNGDLVKVRYKGTFLNGRTFDEGDFDFTLGGNEVVLGFEQGVQRMSVGHKAIVIFPSSLGYGKNGQGSIPPLSPLLFELEVISKM
jgi:FKBP-type peptidyl-prolyl cis-trans isomerase